jgi:hypothetical protein
MLKKFLGWSASATGKVSCKLGALEIYLGL